ncbi:MAG TPA: hypothetical protein VF875_13320 [Anaeromyxobacter sp.]
MSGLALALHLVLAAPPSTVPPGRLAPPLDPGPFQGRELAASTGGILLGDALVIGAAYETLQLFASRAFQPTAGNFRTAAYGLGAAAILVPPLTAALLARLARAEPASGTTWKAVLLAFAGQAVALGVGYLAYPAFWVVLPVQILAIGLGTSAGLHWGPPPRGAGTEPDARHEPAEPPPEGKTARAPICPDPAIGAAG